MIPDRPTIPHGPPPPPAPGGPPPPPALGGPPPPPSVSRSMAAPSPSQGIVNVIVRPYSVYCHVPTWIDLHDPCYLFRCILMFITL